MIDPMHHHSSVSNHEHVHGALDPTLLSTERGIWAVKWSFVGLMITAMLQVIVVIYTGSVALLADTTSGHAPGADRNEMNSLRIFFSTR